MPITAAQLREKSNQPNNAYRNDDLDDLRTIVSVLDGDSRSYLMDEMDGISLAIRVIRTPNNYNDNALNDAIDKLNKFGTFLKSGVGKTNYKRLIDDCQFTLHFKENGKEKVDNALSFLSDYLQLDYKVEDLQNAQPEPGEFREFREPRTVPVEGYEDLMDEMAKGKNFLDSKAHAHEVMNSVVIYMGNFVNSLTKKINRHDPSIKDIDDATKVRDDVLKYKNALDSIVNTSQKKTNNLQEEEEKKKELNQAIQTIKGLPVYLYSGKEISNYKKWQQYGFSRDNIDRITVDTNKTLGLNFDLQKVKELDQRRQINRRADVIIDGIKRDFRLNQASYKEDPAYPGDKLAKEFAARILVNSTPGNLDSLKHEINIYELDLKTEELKSNEHFKGFIEEVKKDPKKFEKVNNDFVSGFSHGGTVEKMFTEYLKKLPAGELKNSPTIARFMPTVLDRIEELQNQAKAKREAQKKEDGTTYIPSQEMAEVILLRHSINVGMNQKDALKVKIPADNCLKNVNRLAMDQRFFHQFAVMEPNVNKFYQGHGGKMHSDFKGGVGKNFEEKPASSQGRAPGM